MAILRKVSSSQGCCRTWHYMKCGFRKTKQNQQSSAPCNLQMDSTRKKCPSCLFFWEGFVPDYSPCPVSVKISFVMQIHLSPEGQGEKRRMSECGKEQQRENLYFGCVQYWCYTKSFLTQVRTADWEAISILASLLVSIALLNCLIALMRGCEDMQLLRKNLGRWQSSHLLFWPVKTDIHVFIGGENSKLCIRRHTGTE